MAMIKAAKKLIVRECDEESKGHFIAYVDEGIITNDVALKLNLAGEIIDSSCDCTITTPYCVHEIALLLHLAAGTRTKKTAVKKVKVSKANTLLADTNITQLREWITKVFLANKDLELQFVHDFTEHKETYTPESVNRITKEAVKAVVNNKRNIDNTLLNKILKLWKVIHEPILKLYHEAPFDHNAFSLFLAVLDSCASVRFSLNTPTRKITDYLNALAKAAQIPILNLENETSFEACMDLYFKNLVDDKGGINIVFLEQLNDLMNNSSGQRQRKIADQFIPIYFNETKRIYSVVPGLASKILDFILTTGLEEYYLPLMKPLPWEYNYNLDLINNLLKHKDTELAEKYCLEQIRQNKREEYDIGYLLILESLYSQRGDTQKLLPIIHTLLPHNYNFENYLLIQSNTTTEAEMKSFRTKILSRARNASRNNYLAATEFVFRLMEHERKYAKMLDYVDSSTPYCLLNKYFEPLALTGKMDFLQKLINKREYWNGNFEGKEDGSGYFHDMYQKLRKYYTSVMIEAMIKNAESPYSTTNNFIQFVKDEREKEKKVKD